jgi:hypothetical protein
MSDGGYPVASVSRRFWRSVLALDARIVAAVDRYYDASARLHLGRRCLTPDSQRELMLEYCEAFAEVRAAVNEMRALQERAAF